MGEQSYISREVQRAFFGSFGGKLRPIQTLAFENLRPECDALVSAQTGSGKTESVLVPVAQDLLQSKQSGQIGLRAILLSPTRALASDLHRRMSESFSKLGLRMDVATSDHRSAGKTPTDILIRTPEGFEGDLFKHPERLEAVRNVVIDELHKFLDSPRGTQVCGELARLSCIAPSHRRLGISATVEDLSMPERCGLLRSPLIIRDPADTGGTEIDYFDWIEEDIVAAQRLIDHMRTLGVRKAIGFVKRKADAETYSHLLNRGFLQGKCFPHHANLSTVDRKRIEGHLRNLPIALVIATTTLEVGIDIGNIDTCILFDPPPDRNSFLQRVGRAGRRSGRRHVICICGRPHRRSTYAALTISSPGKHVDAHPFLAGFLQQIMVYIAHDEGKSLEDICGFALRAFRIKKSITRVILDALVVDGFLDIQNDSIQPTDELTKLMESRQLFRTFAGGNGIRVVEETSGKYLGRAAIGTQANILLGGKGRKILGIHPDTRAAIVSTSDSGTAMFPRNAAGIFEVLAKRYEQKVARNFRV